MLVARPEQIALLAAGRPMRAPLNGGDSSSSSSNASSSTTDNYTTNNTTTTTTNVDKRLVASGAQSAVGISSDSSTISFNSLDQGAIQHAFDLVGASEAGVGTRFDALLQAGRDVFAEAFKVVDANTQLAKALAQPNTPPLPATAHDLATDASASVGALSEQQKTWLVVGGVVLGAVALKHWKGA